MAAVRVTLRSRKRQRLQPIVEIAKKIGLEETTSSSTASTRQRCTSM